MSLLILFKANGIKRAIIGLAKNQIIDISFYSGMWSSSFYLGNFLGPTVAGIMVENFGFQLTTLIVFSLFIFIIIVDSLELNYYLKFVTVSKKQGYIEFDKDKKNIEE